MKKLVLVASAAFSLSIATSCKHSADWCESKVISIDTTLSGIAYTQQVDTINHILGEIIIDTSRATGNAFVTSNIIRRPYYASIDGGRNWQKLPIDDSLLKVGTYKVIIKDGDGCESQTFTQEITY